MVLFVDQADFGRYYLQWLRCHEVALRFKWTGDLLSGVPDALPRTAGIPVLSVLSKPTHPRMRLMLVSTYSSESGGSTILSHVRSRMQTA